MSDFTKKRLRIWIAMLVVIGIGVLAVYRYVQPPSDGVVTQKDLQQALILSGGAMSNTPPPLRLAPGQQPVRLAIVSTSTELDRTVDRLTVEFSKAGKVQLLERKEITRVYQEQNLAAGNGDYLKLGQVLGADGLLFLGINNTNQLLTVDLVAVKPGVILFEQRFKWPLEHFTEWAPALEKQIEPMTPKLTVLAKDAVPISVVNLRSAIQSTEAREAERQLTLLAIERLSRESQLFVLERRRMESLTAEKELKGVEETAFWDGSYLLDGTLDDSGYSKDTITLTARLRPPKGGAPVKIEVSGSRTNYSEVINRLADKVLASLKLNRTGEPWNAAEEAEQFYAEAQWALKWKLYPQAQAAAESAWALGKRDSGSVAALFDAYNQTTPRSWLNPEKVSVEGLPDPNQFQRLTQALSILSENISLYFATSNSLGHDRFSTAYDALFSAAGQLESYYYAAELRVGHERQLAELREKMRDVYKVLAAQPYLSTNQSWQAQADRKAFENLEWTEYGACFERPEDAVPAYREILRKGAVVTSLPRLIGWTWEDRQRVPRLMREFVNEACAATNTATRLEGLYLALLLDPDSENGSLQRAEQELTSAMWNNRDVVFATPGNVSLLKRTEEALQQRYDSYSDGSFNHEPFASFKQRMRVDFLKSAFVTNSSVFGQLFFLSSVPRETPEHARELLALLLAYQPKLRDPKWLEIYLTHFRNFAEIPKTNSNELAEPVRPQEEPLRSRFVNWELRRPGIDPTYKPSFSGMIVRNGQMWVKMTYIISDMYHYAADTKVTYLAVDPKSGVKDEIPFPAKLGSPGKLYEVSSDALFVEASGHLYRFKFSEKTWSEISTPLEGSTGLVWIKDRLFISRSDGLLAVRPDTKSVQVLVSSRRQPPANELDSLWEPGTLIYSQADGRLGALAGTGCFVFNLDTEHWNVRLMPQGTNRYRGNSAEFISPSGAQWLLTGLVARHYLVGFWNQDQPYQSLLMDDTPFQGRFPIDEKILNPVRWEWSREFSLEASDVATGDQQLWVMCPRDLAHMFGFVFKKPVQFSDDRNATLFYFGPEFRQPLVVPIKFETTGAGMDPLSPPAWAEPNAAMRWGSHSGNLHTWMRTPTGLVLGVPFVNGHWFIPDAALQLKLAAQREALRHRSATAPAKQANLEKP